MSPPRLLSFGRAFLKIVVGFSYIRDQWMCHANTCFFNDLHARVCGRVSIRFAKDHEKEITDLQHGRQIVDLIT